MEALYYTLILAAAMCLCLARIHSRLERIWLALDELDRKKLDVKI